MFQQLRSASARVRLPNGIATRRSMTVLVVFVAVMASQLMATPSSRSATTTSVFHPVGDAYVNQAAATTNYGSDPALRTDASPSVLRSYIRFTPSGLSGTVTGATLRVYANSANTTGVAVAAVSDNSWTENGITWTNAPAVGAVVASSGGFAAGTWLSFDITSLVGTNSVVSVAVTTTSSTQTSLAAREAGANGPQLVVLTGAQT